MAPRSKPREKLLHSWLKDKLDSECYPGVRWLNMQERIFQIPWVNQKNQAWKAEKSQLFVEYATFKGHHKSDCTIEFARYKQNFKSAINKSKFIKRLHSENKSCRLFKMLDHDTQEGEKKQCSSHEHSEVHKKLPTYQINQSGMKKNENFNLQGVINIPGLKICEQDSSPAMTPSAEQSVVVSFGMQHTEFSPMTGTLTCGVEGISCVSQQTNQNLPDVGQIFPDNSTQKPATNQTDGNFLIPDFEWQKEFISNLIPNFEQIEINDKAREYSSDAINSCVEGVINDTSGQVSSTSFCKTQNSYSSISNMDLSETLNSLNESEASQLNFVTSGTSPESISSQTVCTIPRSLQEKGVMRLMVIYGSPVRFVMEHVVRTDKCRIFFGKVDNKRIQQNIELRDNAEQIELPSVDKFEFNEKQKYRIQQILDKMELGVVLNYRNDDIYVVRRCKLSVYMSDGVSSSVSLRRSDVRTEDEETKAFNFNENFINSVQRYRALKQKDLIERDHFLLTFGCEIVPKDVNPTKFIPVFIIVKHVQAEFMRSKELGPAALESDPKYSMSNSFDNEIGFSRRFPTI